MDILTHGLAIHLDEQFSRLDLRDPDLGSTLSGPLALETEENKPPSIHMLPAELMVKVFLELDDWLSLAAHAHSPPEWFKVMLVCRHWREIIAAYPYFWHVISVGTRVEWFNLAISRSAGANLRVYFEEPWMLSKALPQLLAESHRIEVLSFKIWTLTQELRPLVETPFPVLTLLDIFAGIRLSPSQRNDLAGGCVLVDRHLPNIRDLRIVHSSLPWTPFLMSRLRSLQLHNCEVSPSALSLDAFLDVLKCGRQLETLSLFEFFSKACPALHPFSNRARPVVLPRLRKLDIYDKFDHVVQFLTFVQIPSGGEVSVGTYARPGDPDNFKRLGLFDATTSARLRIVQGRSWDIRLVASDPVLFDLTLLIFPDTDVATESVDNGVRFLIGVLRDVPLESLALIISPGLLNPVVVEPLLDAFPRLLALEITDHGVYSTVDPTRSHLPISFFRLLRQPTNHPSNVYAPVPNVTMVRCPLLKALRLRGVVWDDFFVKDLVRCLVIRARRGAHRLETLVLQVERPDDWVDPYTEFSDDPDELPIHSNTLHFLADVYVIDTNGSSEPSESTLAWARWAVE
ncbi:hypothetical protein FKP32DRAFT_1646211 [Trametes sanguinea]|nr:hypothetical protein FKP32DRAFT_1646211 [Trametes sanguinea]